MVENGSNDLKGLKKSTLFQTMLKKSWLCLILRTYAQILISNRATGSLADSNFILGSQSPNKNIHIFWVFGPKS